jgi:hypothetical protein
MDQHLYIALVPIDNYSRKVQLALGVQIFDLDEKTIVEQSVSTLGRDHREFEFLIPKDTKFKLSLEEVMPEVPFGTYSERTNLIRAGDTPSLESLGPFTDIVLFSYASACDDFK